MGDGPEEEQDTSCTEQSRHGVDHFSYLSGITNEMGKEVCRKHEERCAWWVTHFKEIACSDKFRAVPEGCRRFDGRTIHKGSDEERHPAKRIIYKSKMFHWFCFIVIVFFFAIFCRYTI